MFNVESHMHPYKALTDLFAIEIFPAFFFIIFKDRRVAVVKTA